MARIFPRGFRETVGSDMITAFRAERARVRRQRGAVRAAWWTMRTIAGALPAAVLEWVSELRRWVGGGASRDESAKGYAHHGGTTMKTVWEEIRWDLRTFGRQALRRPSFSLLVILTLALGIGATTTVYSVVRGVLLSPLPYPAGDRVVEITGGGASSLPNFRDLEERVQAFDVMGAFTVPAEVAMVGEGEPVQLAASRVTGGLFRLLGVEPAIGRLLGPDDIGTPRAVLSHGLWRKRFGGDPAAVGQTITLDDEGYEVVGVAPSSLTRPFDQDLWLPLPVTAREASRASRNIYLYGRIAPGRDIEGAREEVLAEFARLQEEHPEANARWSVSVESLRAQVTGDQSLPLLLLLGSAGLFLLIACANVASVLVSRLMARRREYAVRVALGASRARLLRQAWTETLALSLLGGAFGVGLTFLGVDGVVAIFGGTLSRAEAVTVNGGVLLFAGGISLLTALLVGTMWVAGSRPHRPGILLRTRSGAGSGAGVLRKGLVVGQVAVALVLATSLGLLVKSYAEIQGVELGVRAEEVTVATLGSLPGSRYPTNESRSAFVAELLHRLEALPDVDAVAATTKLPLSGCCSNGPMARADDPERVERFVEGRRVSRDYFDVVGMRVLQGRGFGPEDRPGASPVLVINQELARRLFGDEVAVGRSIAAFGTELGVVGVVSDVREYSPLQPPPPVAYLSSEQVGPGRPHLVVRGQLPPERVEELLRGVLRELDPLLPVGSVTRLDDTVARTLGDRRATTALMSLIAFLAVFLGGVGIYGVINQLVHGQVREIGIRMALGARREAVLGSVVAGSFRLVLPGLALGLLGAFLARGALESLLFQVDTFDPWVYATVVLAFLLVATGSALGPARRAARIQPKDALREG